MKQLKQLNVEVDFNTWEAMQLQVSTLMHMCIVVIAGPDGNDGTPDRKLVKQNVAIQVGLFSHQRNIKLSICFILVGLESIF